MNRRICLTGCTLLACVGWGALAPRSLLATAPAKQARDTDSAAQFLPLFPLYLVAFPGELVLLHIFEPRYKQLVAESAEGGVTVARHAGRARPAGISSCTSATNPVAKITMDNTDMDLASGIAAFEAKEFRRARQLLQPLAESGNAEAQYRLAVQYQAGLGVVANPPQAIHWMREAAAQDHGLALHGLGIMYLYGECVEKNERQAAECLQRAADQGLAGSMAVLAGMYEQGLGVEKNAARAKELHAAAESVDMPARQ